MAHTGPTSHRGSVSSSRSTTIWQLASRATAHPSSPLSPQGPEEGPSSSPFFGDSATPGTAERAAGRARTPSAAEMTVTAATAAAATSPDLGLKTKVLSYRSGGQNARAPVSVSAGPCSAGGLQRGVCSLAFSASGSCLHSLASRTFLHPPSALLQPPSHVTAALPPSILLAPRRRPLPSNCLIGPTWETRAWPYLCLLNHLRQGSWTMYIDILTGSRDYDLGIFGGRCLL